MKIGFLQVFYLAVFAFFSLLMLQITLAYIPIDFKASFLFSKEEEIKHLYYQIAFFTHVYTAMFALVAGFTQFSSYLLRYYAKIHRIIGMLYVVVILCFAAPSGLVMAYHANGGIIAKTSFVILGILWFYFTLEAFVQAKKRNFVLHKNYMYRSFALTVSALTLRAWKVILVYTLDPAPMDRYRVIAWLGWVPNLILAEYLIFKMKKHNTKKI